MIKDNRMLLPGASVLWILHNLQSGREWLWLAIQKVLNCQSITLHTKAWNYTDAFGCDQTLVPEFFPGIHVGYVYFSHRCFYGADGIMNGNRCMGVRSGVYDNTIKIKTHFMEFVDDLTFHIRLIAMQLNRCESFFQFLEIVFKSLIAINCWFTFAQKIEVRSVDDLYFHKSNWLPDSIAKILKHFRMLCHLRIAPNSSFVIWNSCLPQAGVLPCPFASYFVPSTPRTSICTSPFHLVPCADDRSLHVGLTHQTI